MYLSKLEVRQLAELRKLETASEDFEAVFVKGLRSQMRRSSFSEDIAPMGDLAKDMVDQALAESLSRGPGSIGIAKDSSRGYGPATGPNGGSFDGLRERQTGDASINGN